MTSCFSDEETEAPRGDNIIISYKRNLTVLPPSCSKYTKLGESWVALRNDTINLRFQIDQILKAWCSETRRTPCFPQDKELAQVPPRVVVIHYTPLQGQALSLDSGQLGFAAETGQHGGLS